MKIGCQIGVWGGSAEDAVRGMGAAGIEGIEVFTNHIAPYYGVENEARYFLATHNIELTGAYFGNEKFISTEDEDVVVSEASAAAKFLGKVGAPFIILNGGVSKNQKPDGFSDDDFKQLGKTMNSIGKAVLEYGVAACMHPHAGCMIESPQDLDRLLEHLDTSLVGLCLHAAHQVIAGYDPYEMYEEHAALVKYLHIGEIDADKKGALLGEGILDQHRLMKPILDAGYDGWIIIESSKEGVPPKDYVSHAKRYIEEELLS
ncbi:MAG: sugar phosphate isomerase/epimerase family protein [Candidatus Poribacteria bacterium]